MTFSELTGHGDRASGVVFAAIGAFLLLEGSDLPVGSLNAPDAGFFPTILSVLLLVFGGALIAMSFRTPAGALDFTSRSWATAAGAGVLLLYAGLLDRIGFLICTTVVLLLLTKVYGRLSWWVSLAVTLSTVFAAYLGFKQLGVPLPAGILGLD
jgi:putative tricarboxylic transport membrane protein